MSAMSPEMIERTNALRRESFDEAVGEGNRWLVECTDDFVFGLSRRKHGFDSRRGRHYTILDNVYRELMHQVHHSVHQSDLIEVGRL